MRNSGFKEVYEMNGGILAWNKSGKPTVSPKISADPNMTMEDLQKNLNKDKLILVDFNAPWCAPCKKMAPMLEELSNNQNEMMHLLKINVDDHKKLAASMEVYILPTLILYKNDKIVWRNEGFIESKKLLEVIQSFN
jgi:thioredoxin